MGISMSVENAVGQEVDVILSLRTSRRHVVKSVSLKPGESRKWTDNGISASCVYDWWVQPSCPKTGRQLGWWRFPCRAPGFHGEHAYRIVHLDKDGHMEFVVREMSAETREANVDATSDWDEAAKARVFTAQADRMSENFPLRVKDWLVPRTGSLTDALAAYEELPGGGWSHDAFSPLKDFQDVDGVEVAEVQNSAEMTPSELLTAMLGPGGDFLDRYHRRRGDTNVDYSVSLGGRGETASSSRERCDSSSSSDGRKVNGPNWCGIGFLTGQIKTPSGYKQLDTQFRFLACRDGSREVALLQTCGQMSGFPGARAFRSETLYLLSSKGGSRGMELKSQGLIKFTSDTYLRSLIEPRAWDGICKAYPDFIAEVRRTASNLAGGTNGAASDSPVADAIQPSRLSLLMKPLAQTLTSTWWTQPAVSPVQLLFFLVFLFLLLSSGSADRWLFLLQNGRS